MTAPAYSPGLEGAIAGETATSSVGDGLRYRGYPAAELAEHTTFDEVAYLLIYGDRLIRPRGLYTGPEARQVKPLAERGNNHSSTRSASEGRKYPSLALRAGSALIIISDAVALRVLSYNEVSNAR